MATRRFNVEISVGVFLLVGLGCITWLALRMGDTGLGEGGRYTLEARFSSSSGLREGAYVEVAGVRVGKVVDIALDPVEYASIVTVSIDEGVRLQEDAIASVRTSGIIGDKFVKITPGGSDVLLEPGDAIFETEPSISLEELISKYIFEK